MRNVHALSGDIDADKPVKTMLKNSIIMKPPQANCDFILILMVYNLLLITKFDKFAHIKSLISVNG